MKKLFTLALSLLISFTASALDVSKLDSSSFIGGVNPWKAKPRTTKTYQHTPPNANVKPLSQRYKSSSANSSLDAQIRNYQQSKKNNSIKNVYSSSSHAQALDAQIRNYRASARENERVFGAPFRKTQSVKSQSSSKSKLERLIEQGVLSIVVGKDGKARLVENR